MFDFIMMIYTTLRKSHFWRENVMIFVMLYAMLLLRSLHIITESVNHKWFIDFNTWGYITPRRATSYGPRHDKTCLRGFRQSKFQTTLLSYRD